MHAIIQACNLLFQKRKGLKGVTLAAGGPSVGTAPDHLAAHCILLGAGHACICHRWSSSWDFSEICCSINGSLHLSQGHTCYGVLHCRFPVAGNTLPQCIFGPLDLRGLSTVFS